MSIYRSIIAAVAAMTMAGAVLADDTAAPATTDTTAQPAATQPADQSAAPSTPATTDQSAAAPADQAKVNVNTATAKDLMQVKGLNAAKAKAIVSYRKKHGDFKTLDDLKMVKGFKKMKDDDMKAIQDQLTTG